MSTQLHNVRRNFERVMRAITPTSTISPNGFATMDPTVDVGKDASNWTRRFWVQWRGSDRDSAATDSDRREAWHEYVVTVLYPTCVPWGDLQDMIAQDRHQLHMELRAQGNRLGYDANYTTTDIGLYQRECTGDEIDDNTDPEVHRLRLSWRCKIRENER
jgi:hypothetical protein